MQTLGLSESAPRSEGRLKSLFWPSIQTGSDVDYLGAQGYWVCTFAALLSFVFSTASGHPLMGALVSVCSRYLDRRHRYSQGSHQWLVGLEPSSDMDCFTMETGCRRGHYASPAE